MDSIYHDKTNNQSRQYPSYESRFTEGKDSLNDNYGTGVGKQCMNIQRTSLWPLQVNEIMPSDKYSVNTVLSEILPWLNNNIASRHMPQNED